MVKAARPPPRCHGFQGKDLNEEFQFCFHQHWIRLLWPVTKLVVYNALIFGIGYMTLMYIGVVDPNTRRLFLLTLTLLFFLSHTEFLVRFYRYFLYIIVVTDKKVHRIKKTLLTIDDHQSVDIWMLQDIHKCQHGIVQNFLRYGSLVLEAQDTVLRIHFVPQIAKKYDQLINLRERARTRLEHAARTASNSYIERVPAEIFYPPEIPLASRKEVLYWQHVRAEEQRRLAAKSA